MISSDEIIYIHVAYQFLKVNFFKKIKIESGNRERDNNFTKEQKITLKPTKGFQYSKQIPRPERATASP